MLWKRCVQTTGSVRDKYNYNYTWVLCIVRCRAIITAHTGLIDIESPTKQNKNLQETIIIAEVEAAKAAAAAEEEGAECLKALFIAAIQQQRAFKRNVMHE